MDQTVPTPLAQVEFENTVGASELLFVWGGGKSFQFKLHLPQQISFRGTTPRVCCP